MRKLANNKNIKSMQKLDNYKTPKPSQDQSRSPSSSISAVILLQQCHELLIFCRRKADLLRFPLLSFFFFFFFSGTDPQLSFYCMLGVLFWPKLAVFPVTKRPRDREWRTLRARERERVVHGCTTLSWCMTIAAIKNEKIKRKGESCNVHVDAVCDFKYIYKKCHQHGADTRVSA